jgi:hypothetical protein
MLDMWSQFIGEIWSQDLGTKGKHLGAEIQEGFYSV